MGGQVGLEVPPLAGGAEVAEVGQDLQGTPGSLWGQELLVLVKVGGDVGELQ